MIFSGVTILQGVEFPIFPIDFAWALQQCSATALPVIAPRREHTSKALRYNDNIIMTTKTMTATIMMMIMMIMINDNHNNSDDADDYNGGDDNDDDDDDVMQLLLTNELLYNAERHHDE